MNSRHYSSRSLFVTLIAFLGYFSGMFTSAANDTAAMTKEELVAALKRETENFKNYSVEIEFENEEFMPGLPVSFYGSKGTLIQQAEVNDRFHYIQHVISISGNMSLQKKNEKYTLPTVRTEGVFDRSMLRELTGDPDQPGSAVVWPRASQTAKRLNPEVYLNRYFHRSILEWIVEGQGEITGYEKLEGQNVIVTETAPVLVDGVEWKQKFWISPERSFMPLKRSANSRKVPEGEWREYTSIVTSGYQQTPEGIWLPSKGEYRAVNVGNGTSPEPPEGFPLSSRHRVTFRNWKVNLTLTEDDFDLAFPVGTFVNDHVTGLNYRIPDPTELDK